MATNHVLISDFLRKLHRKYGDITTAYVIESDLARGRISERLASEDLGITRHAIRKARASWDEKKTAQSGKDSDIESPE